MATTSFETPLAEATFVVFDFETTGLDVTKGARVVEAGALKLFRGDVAGHFLTLVDPEVPVPAGATAVHGLTDADLAGQPKLAEVFPRFAAFAADAALVAHNLPFDMSFVVAATTELGLPKLPNATVDLLGLARSCHPGLDSYKLESLARTFNVTNPAPHRALGDAAVESQLLLAFAAEARERFGAETVGDLALLSRGIPGEEGLAAGTVVALEWAAAAGEAVAIIYRGGKGESSRSITPYAIKTRGGRCYVAAYCHASEAKREFRLDRLLLAADEE
jgi:DNA polymerase III epsilon subunit family exonuclease